MIKMRKACFCSAPRDEGQRLKFQISLKIDCQALPSIWRINSGGEQTLSLPNWRRERDSNPRRSYTPLNRLAGDCLQPLGHLSEL